MWTAFLWCPSLVCLDPLSWRRLDPPALGSALRDQREPSITCLQFLRSDGVASRATREGGLWRERRSDATGADARKASGPGPTRTWVLGAPRAAKPDKADALRPGGAILRWWWSQSPQPRSPARQGGAGGASDGMESPIRFHETPCQKPFGECHGVTQGRTTFQNGAPPSVKKRRWRRGTRPLRSDKSVRAMGLGYVLHGQECPRHGCRATSPDYVSRYTLAPDSTNSLDFSSMPALSAASGAMPCCSA